MKTLVKYSAAGVFCVACLSFVLGNNFVPWLMTAKQSAANHLLELVDQYELKLQQANGKITDYEHAVVAQAKRRSRMKSMLDKLDHGLDESRAAIAAHRGKLVSLQARLVDHGTVFTSTGRTMSSTQIQAAIDQSRRAITFAQQRIESLNKLSQPCEQQLAALDHACEIAPTRIASLRTYCKDLEGKITLAKEMQQWTDEMLIAQSGGDRTPEHIEQALREIETDIDGEVAGLSTLLSIRHPDGAPSLPVPTENLIAQIDDALGTDTGPDLLADF